MVTGVSDKIIQTRNWDGLISLVCNGDKCGYVERFREIRELYTIDEMDRMYTHGKPTEEENEQ